MLRQFQQLEQLFSRLNHKYPEELLYHLLYMPELTEQDLLQESQMHTWSNHLATKLQAYHLEGKKFTLEVTPNDQGQYIPSVTLINHGVPINIHSIGIFLRQRNIDKFVILVCY